MATFPVEYADRQISGQSGGVRANLNVDTGQREIAQAVSGLGKAVDERNEKIKLGQNAMRLSILDREYDEITNAYEQQLSKITDEDESNALMEKYQADVAKLSADDKPDVQQAYGIRTNQKIGEQLGVFNKIGQATRAKDAYDKWKFSYGRAVDMGNVEGAKETAALALQTGVIGQAEFDKKMAELPVDILFAKARKDMVTNPVGVIEQLSSEDFTSKLSVKQLETNAKLLGTARKQKKVVGTEANKDLTDMMAGRTLTLSEVQARRAQLDDEDYEAWTKIALRPDDKKGNRIKESELKSMSMDVWRGSLSRENAESQIRKSLADPNGINDEQYASVVSDLDREVKGFQAQDTKTYSVRATQSILGKDAGVMSFDSFGNMSLDINKMLSPQADFEKKMHFVDLYNEGMMNYLADNPKASKKELYVKSQELKATYVSAAKGETVVGGLSAEKEARRQELLRKAGK